MLVLITYDVNTTTPERKDRSYQWGRLLAVMEKIEQDTYDRTEDRQTNAIRMQSAGRTR